jgi:hypothetical protein
MEIIRLGDALMAGEKPVEFNYVPGAFLCGGAVRRWFAGKEKLSDLDFFFEKADALAQFKSLNAEKLGAPSRNDDAIEVYSVGKMPVQLIKKIGYMPLAGFFDKFDYTLCQFAYDGQTVYSTPEAVTSVLRRHLAVHRIQAGCELDSLRRAFKYAQKGYLPCIGTLQDIAKALSEVKLASIEQQVQISPNGGHRTGIRWD